MYPISVSLTTNGPATGRWPSSTSVCNTHEAEPLKGKGRDHPDLPSTQPAPKGLAVGHTSTVSAVPLPSGRLHFRTNQWLAVACYQTGGTANRYSTMEKFVQVEGFHQSAQLLLRRHLQTVHTCISSVTRTVVLVVVILVLYW